jgi:predicted alpha-1,2-mannosidase
MLDSVFALPPVYDESYYGFPIHEIREMQAIRFGQYAHGNQPIQHLIYLYNYAGEPWKTQYWAREVMNRLYTSGADGYCGDEDNGQTSAWYIFSAMGFYPVCPGTDEYVLGAPLFPQVDIKLETGAKLQIIGSNNPTSNRYVGQLLRNGALHTKNYVQHGDLLKGGRLEFRMQSTPDNVRGTSEKAFPYSYSTQK